MKKIISFILVFAVCLLLCACSKGCDCDCEYCCEENSKSSNVTSPSKKTSTEETIANPDLVEFSEPVLLAEDEKIKVELIGFRQVESDSSASVMDKYITLKFYNKADYEIAVMLENLSIDGEPMDCTYHRAQIPEILPGENLTQYFNIHTTFDEPLNSIEMLYKFTGRFEVYRRTGEGRLADGYDLLFSVEDALDGVVGQAIEYETQPPKDDTQGVFTMEFAEPVLLAEDKNLKLEIINFYQDVWEPSNQPSYTRAHITIRFQNKANYEMMITPDVFYIGDERAICVQSDGTPNLLAGKSGNYSFHIKYDTDEPLNSLDDLYQLNGRFEVYRHENDTLYDGYYFPISVGNAFS